MSRYINWSDLVMRYPDVAKFVGAEETNASWAVFAEAEIDARFARIYSVPFATSSDSPPTPPQVKDLAIDLAYYKMGLTRGKNSEALLEDINRRFNDIIAGKMALLSSSLDVMSRLGDRTYSNTAGYHSAFGMGDPITWRVSSQQLLDEAFERGDRGDLL